jgi:ankyrin repeat protein
MLDIFNEARNAIKDGNISEVERLVSENENLLHETDEDGKSLLYYAAVLYPNYEIVISLLEKNMEAIYQQIVPTVVDTEDKMIKFALQSRINEKWLKLVCKERPDYFETYEELISKPEDLGVVLLLTATINDDLPLIDILLKNGVQIETPNPHGDTVLNSASSFGHLQVVKKLAAHGADINTRNNFGNTPLHNAISNGHADVVKCLLKNGADPNKQNLSDVTPLHCAVKAQQVDIVKELLLAGADAGLVDEEGCLALSDAIKWANKRGDATSQQILDLLLIYTMTSPTTNGGAIKKAFGQEMIEPVSVQVMKFKEKLKKYPELSHHPLHCCAVLGNVTQLVKFLNNNKQIINQKMGKLKNTPLHLAAENGNAKVVIELLNHGANLNTLNKEGENPLQLAIRNGHTEIVNLIFTHQNLDFNSKKDLSLIVSTPGGIDCLFKMLKKKQCPVRSVLSVLLTTPPSNFIDLCPEKDRAELSKILEDTIIKNLKAVTGDVRLQQALFDLVINKQNIFSSTSIRASYISVLSTNAQDYATTITEISERKLFLDMAFSALDPTSNMGRILWEPSKTQEKKKYAAGRAVVSVGNEMAVDINTGNLGKIWGLIKQRVKEALDNKNVDALFDLKRRLGVLAISINSANNKLTSKQKENVIRWITLFNKKVEENLPQQAEPVVALAPPMVNIANTAQLLSQNLYPDLVQQASDPYAYASAPPVASMTNVASSSVQESALSSRHEQYQACDANGIQYPIFTPIASIPEFHMNVIQRELDSGNKIDICPETKESALSIAAKQGDVERVKKLLKYLTNLQLVRHALPVADATTKKILTDYLAKYKQYEGLPPLHFAVATENNALIESLVNDININKLDMDERTPLDIAAYFDDANIAAFLLSKGANPLLRTHDNMTPFHLACKFGRHAVVNLLLECGILSRMSHKEIDLAVGIAISNRQMTILSQLSAHGVDVSARCNEALINEIKQRDLLMVRLSYVRNKQEVINQIKLTDKSIVSLLPYITYTTYIKEMAKKRGFKEAILTAIKQIDDDIECIDYLMSCLIPRENLGKIFWTQRGLLSATLSQGALAKVQELLVEKIKHALLGNNDIKRCAEMFAKIHNLTELLLHNLSDEPTEYEYVRVNASVLTAVVQTNVDAIKEKQKFDQLKASQKQALSQTRSVDAGAKDAPSYVMMSQEQVMEITRQLTEVYQQYRSFLNVNKKSEDDLAYFTSESSNINSNSIKIEDTAAAMPKEDKGKNALYPVIIDDVVVECDVSFPENLEDSGSTSADLNKDKMTENIDTASQPKEQYSLPFSELSDEQLLEFCDKEYQSSVAQYYLSGTELSDEQLLEQCKQQDSTSKENIPPSRTWSQSSVNNKISSVGGMFAKYPEKVSHKPQSQKRTAKAVLI